MSQRNDDGTFRGKRAKILTNRAQLARFVEAEAVRLKRLGMGFSRIAARITEIGRGEASALSEKPEGLQFPDGYKISAQGAQKAYQRAIGREPALAVDEFRRLDVDRCEEWLLTLQPAIRRGESKSVEAGIRILVHRAKLLGLEAPKRLEMSGKDGKPIEIVSEPVLTDEQRKARTLEIAKLLKEVGAINDD
jgi:hypothetical protein